MCLPQECEPLVLGGRVRFIVILEGLRDRAGRAPAQAPERVVRAADKPWLANTPSAVRDPFIRSDRLARLTAVQRSERFDRLPEVELRVGPVDGIAFR